MIKMDQKPRYVFKLVVLGESGVGKSSLITRYTKNKFDLNQEPTIGACFISNKIVLDNSIVQFDIWDTAGQERYYCLAPLYYRGASIAIIVYDISDHQSFLKAKFWIDELRKQESFNIMKVLVCNKIDLIYDYKVDMDEAKKYASNCGLLFVETSAKNNQGVKQLFETIAELIPKTETALKKSPVAVKFDPEKEKKYYCCYK